ncbi:MAG TPA: cytochrome c maturation protein CcmE [Polyangia bacterium]|nr:cytochrome c maturation protein CcmE [Polyangia bacterium]
MRYTGWVPDAFRSNTEIIADGRLAGLGRLEVVPDGIIVKCPGKYDPDNPPDWQCPDPAP